MLRYCFDKVETLFNLEITRASSHLSDLSPDTKDTIERVRPYTMISLDRLAAVGLLIPTAALLLTLNAPSIGLRYLYYSYALVFLYVACAVASHKSESLFKLSAIAICMFGLVTWTYPTVAVLLIW